MKDFRKVETIEMDDCSEAVGRRTINGVTYDMPAWLNAGW